MTRIVLVGAGSVEFTRNLLGDILSFEALRDAELVLHDIDADRLRHRASAWRAWTAGGAAARRRRSARTSTGAPRSRARTIVIDTIQVGGARATQIDFDIPGRYGLQYTINDTINVGGVHARACARSRSSSASSADMADVCPDALFLNYTNPMGMLVRAVDEAVELPDRRPVPLASTGPSTTLAGYIGVPSREVDALSAGVNHLAWILRARAPRPGPVPGPARRSSRRAGSPTTTSSGPTCSGGSASTRPSRPSTTPSTTRGSSPRARSSRSTSRSAST